MKRVLIISQGYWPEVFPINTIVNNLSKSKFRIDVLTGYPNYPKGKIYDGYNSYKVSLTNRQSHRIIRVPIISRGMKSKVRILLNYLSFILSSIIFGPLYLRKKKYDIILVYGTSPIFQVYIGIFFKLLKNAKLVTWVQDLWPNILKDTGIIKSKLTLKILSFFVKQIYDSNDLLLAQSVSFKKEIKKITRTTVKVLYNPGYSEIKIIKSNFKKKINILYAGNLGNAQPWDQLLNFLRKKNNKVINFTICGDGQKLNYIKNYVKKYDMKNIYVKGFIKGKKLEQEYKKNNFLLLMLKPGKDLNKTIPSKFQTYLSQKRPILALSEGEVYDLVSKNNLGFAARPNKNLEIEQMFKNISNLTEKKYKNMSNNTINFYTNNFSQMIINRKLKDDLNKI